LRRRFDAEGHTASRRRHDLRAQRCPPEPVRCRRQPPPPSPRRRRAAFAIAAFRGSRRFSPLSRPPYAAVSAAAAAVYAAAYFAASRLRMLSFLRFSIFMAFDAFAERFIFAGFRPPRRWPLAFRLPPACFRRHITPLIASHCHAATPRHAAARHASRITPLYTAAYCRQQPAAAISFQASRLHCRFLRQPKYVSAAMRMRHEYRSHQPFCRLPMPPLQRPPPPMPIASAERLHDDARAARIYV